MKPTLLLATAVFTLDTAVQAQWAVYDAANHSQQIINGAQEIAKFVEMINNQIQQIEHLTEQVNTLHHYVDLFGNPASIAPASVAVLTTELRRTELGETLTELRATADAASSMLDDGGGL